MKLLLFFILTFSLQLQAQIKIAVIDTGLGYEGLGRSEANLCPTGHKDFTSEQSYYLDGRVIDPVPIDYSGHGTNIVGVITDQLKGFEKHYCIIVLKYFAQADGEQNLAAEIKAIHYATELNVKFINYSSSGTGRSESEVLAVKKFVDAGGVFITAAGNDSKNIDLAPVYPAASDERVIVVGNLDYNGTKYPSSNYGKIIDVWEYGVNIRGFGLTMSGTSQSTAIVTSKKVKNIVKLLYKRQ